jgi:two-component system sensor histidine kinase EvgS
MPVMDGLEFTRAVRARPDAHGGVPIIGCTASAVAGDHAAALAAGMDAVLVKPVGLQALDAAVSQACGGRPRTQQAPVPEPVSPTCRQEMPVGMGHVSGDVSGNVVGNVIGNVARDSSRCQVEPLARASWCAVCRAMNVQCDRLDRPDD